MSLIPFFDPSHEFFKALPCARGKLWHFHEAVAGLRRLRKIRLSSNQATAVKEELGQIRELLLGAQRTKHRRSGGKMIYLAGERMPDEEANVSSSKPRPAETEINQTQSAILSRPLRTMAREQLDELILEMDLTIFSLEQRFQAPPILESVKSLFRREEVPAEPMRMWPIPTRVNSPRNDDADLLTPIE